MQGWVSAISEKTKTMGSKKHLAGKLRHVLVSDGERSFPPKVRFGKKNPLPDLNRRVTHIDKCASWKKPPLLKLL
jgi:hypothetical protein